MSVPQPLEYEEYTLSRPSDGRLLSIVPADQPDGLVERLGQMRENGADMADLRIKKNKMRKCIIIDQRSRRSLYYPRESETFTVDEFLQQQNERRAS